MESSYFTAVEISKLFKISRALAYRMISQGQIPSVRFGKTVRVKSEDLQKFIDQSIESNPASSIR